MFELNYPAWDANGVRVSETKRITLDAGQNFDRFESHYTYEGSPELTDAIGIRKGPEAVSSADREHGSLRAWEKLSDKDGRLGCAVILDPANISGVTEDKNNFLITTKIPQDKNVTYYAGFGWSKNGFATVGDWDRYVAQYASRLKAPLEVTLSASGK
jgi:hypothetical protein